MNWDVGRIFVEATRLRQEQELRVVHVVLNEPAAGVAEARRLGVTDAVFTREDLALIWEACVASGRGGRDAAVELGTELLTARDLIHPEGRGVTGIWSPTLLRRFANHFAAEPAPAIQRLTLAIEVPRLIEMHQGMRDANEHLKHAVRLIEEVAIGS